jgi:tetratricopeptide (TPR) repeat protein
MRSALLLAFLAAAAPAQDKTAPLAMDAILVKPEEMPKDVKLVDGIHGVSPQAQTYFETPSVKEITKKLTPEAVDQFPKGVLEGFPVPKRKECQSFEAQGYPAGSVFVYEYDDDGKTAGILPFLTSYIWGDRRSEQHPEEIVAEGRFLWVISFPYPRPNPAAEWYKERLRQKLRVHALKEHLECIPLMAQLGKAYSAEDADAGIQVIRDNPKLVESWALGQYLLGEFGTMKKDYALAEQGYRKALELHDSVTDPVEPGILYATLDGLGLALHAQGKREEAVKILKRAVAAADDTGGRAMQSKAHSSYNLACAYAMMKKYPESLAALQQAIHLDPSCKKDALADDDLAEARKRKEFQELLK